MAMTYEVESMKIKLINEWMGHKEGSVLDLVKTAALRLIRMGTAELYAEKKGGDEKEISSPPKDKMVKRPVRNKSI